MSGTIVPGTPPAMSKLTRRSFLAAAGVAAASAGVRRGPAEIQSARRASRGPASTSSIIGAGAAGIAAARRIVAAGRKCVVLEASGAVGGRCITDTALFGVPYDRGARALHTPESNPVARLATQNGFDIYPAPPGQRMRIARRYARESEMEDMLAAMVRANARHRRRRAQGRRRHRAGAAEGSRRMALDHRVHAGSVFLRQGRVRDLGRRSRARRRARRAGLLPAGPRRGDREARRRPAGAAVDAGHAHQLGRPRRRRGRDRAGNDRCARRHRHGLDQCAGRRQAALHARSAEAPARR